jgi:type 1 glutamine amidotransferase
VLEGEAVNPKRPAVVNPVAWMWKNEYGARSFYTSLGHPGDMGLEPVQRLLVNAMHELLGRKVKKWTGSLAIDVPYRGMVKTGA